MTETVILASNFVTAKLAGASRELTNVVANFLSYEVEGAEFSAVAKAGHWDGRSSFYSRREDTFPAGFVDIVYGELRRLGHTVHLRIKAAQAPLGPENPTVDGFGNADPRYDFQLDALKAVESHHRGIIQVATGGGKSKIAKLIVARYRRMTLFLTTRGILMYQMADGFREAGFNAGIIGDGIFKPVKGINCGMVQTFVAKLRMPDLHAEATALIEARAKGKIKLNDAELSDQTNANFQEKMRERARYIKLLEMFEVVIGEEAHEAGGNSYYEILRYAKNASIKVALTATPFMRADSEDNMRLMAAFGSKLIQVSEKTLIDRGILAKPYFRLHSSRKPKGLFRTTPWQRAYTIGYTENEFMTADIVAEALKAKSRGLPVMTLVQRVPHGKTLEKAMKALGIKVLFIRGENNQDERKRALNMLRDHKIDVLIGTTILDVGVDVPAVGLVQLAGGGKAEVALRQRIGRGLRAKKTGPNVAFITDYSCDLNLDLQKHAIQRRAIIETTPGFAEQILDAGKDFDWNVFGGGATL